MNKKQIRITMSTCVRNKKREKKITSVCSLIDRSYRYTKGLTMNPCTQPATFYKNYNPAAQPFTASLSASFSLIRWVTPFSAFHQRRQTKLRKTKCEKKIHLVAAPTETDVRKTVPNTYWKEHILTWVFMYVWAFTASCNALFWPLWIICLLFD